MGQVALGFRSLLTKVAIFFVMAALLAWALGGTLWPRFWPRPYVADKLNLQTAHVGDDVYFWQITITRPTQSDGTWRLWKMGAHSSRALADDRMWIGGAGPVAREGSVFFGGLMASGQWVISTPGSDGSADAPMPDRLAVEQQLARLAAGLPLQDQETILRQRSAVLDPADEVIEG